MPTHEAAVKERTDTGDVSGDNVKLKKKTEIRTGSEVSFSLGFDSQRLRELAERFIADSVREDADTSFLSELRNRKSNRVAEQTQRRVAMLNNFALLPGNMQFEPGPTLIFGDNGSGKTILADAISMAVQKALFMQERGDDADPSDPANIFRPRIPGYSGQGLNGNDPRMDAHVEFVYSIAECIDVHQLTLPEGAQSVEITSALRTAAALGNVAMGVSTRQAIGELEGARGGRSLVDIYDEPELGLSPRKQNTELDAMVEARAAGIVGLVPTNSGILFTGNRPRIDLDVPELGVHVPNTDS